MPGTMKPVVVYQSPNKPNITYDVVVTHETAKDTLAPLVEQN